MGVDFGDDDETFRPFEETEEDIQLEKEMARELFDELRASKPSLPLADFMAWEDIVDVMSTGVIDDETMKVIIEEVGIKDDMITFEQVSTLPYSFLFSRTIWHWPTLSAFFPYTFIINNIFPILLLITITILTRVRHFHDTPITKFYELVDLVNQVAIAFGEEMDELDDDDDNNDGGNDGGAGAGSGSDATAQWILDAMTPKK